MRAPKRKRIRAYLIRSVNMYLRTWRKFSNTLHNCVCACVLRVRVCVCVCVFVYVCVIVFDEWVCTCANLYVQAALAQFVRSIPNIQIKSIQVSTRCSRHRPNVNCVRVCACVCVCVCVFVCVCMCVFQTSRSSPSRCLHVVLDRPNVVYVCMCRWT